MSKYITIELIKIKKLLGNVILIRSWGVLRRNIFSKKDEEYSSSALRSFFLSAATSEIFTRPGRIKA
jgi:hypothetical protein